RGDDEPADEENEHGEARPARGGGRNEGVHELVHGEPDPGGTQEEPEIDDPAQQDRRLEEDAVERMADEARDGIRTASPCPFTLHDLDLVRVVAEPVEDEEVVATLVLELQERVDDLPADDAERPILAADVRLDERPHESEVSSGGSAA